MLILLASAISFVKLESVRDVFLDLIDGKCLDILQHVSGGSTPLPFVGINSLIDELVN